MSTPPPAGGQPAPRPMWCYTLRELAYVERTWTTQTVAQQAKGLRVPLSRVRGIRARLLRDGAVDPAARAGHRPWTERELMTAAAQLQGGANIDRVARRLGRAKRALLRRLETAGYTLTELTATVYNQNQVAALFGVTLHVIRRWTRAGLLRHERTAARQPHYRIARRHIVTFIGDYRTWMLWAPAQITDPELRALAAQVRAQSPYRWLTLAEVARRYGVDETAAGLWLQLGLLPGTRIGRGPWSVWSGDLVNWTPPAIRRRPRRRQQQEAA